MRGKREDLGNKKKEEGSRKMRGKWEDLGNERKEGGSRK